MDLQANLQKPTPLRLRDGLAVFALEGSRVRIGIAAPVVLDHLTSDEAAFVARLESPSSTSLIEASKYPVITDRLRSEGLLAGNERLTTSRVCVIGADDIGTMIALSLAQAPEVDEVTIDDPVPFAPQTHRHLNSRGTRAHSAARAINMWESRTTEVSAHRYGFAIADVAVVVAHGAPSVTVLGDLMASDTPHLPVVSDELGVTIGPLVVPGQSPCMRCLGIYRAEVDPDWPLVAIQCNDTRQSHATTPVRSFAIAVVCDLVVRFLSERAPYPRQWRVTNLEPGEPTVTDWLVTRHPSCRCANALVSGDDLEDLQTVLF